MSMLLSTSTATLVLFDPEILREKLAEECDWWTGDGDLEVEAQAGKLAFIDTGADGYYWVSVLRSPAQTEAPVVKHSTLRVESGTLIYGPGEGLPGEGVAVYDDMGQIEVPPGLYDVTVHGPLVGDRGIPEYVLRLSPREG